MKKHFYAVSGKATAETLHIFADKESRDKYVSDFWMAGKTDYHHTMSNLQSATKKEAIDYMGESVSSFDQRVSNWDKWQVYVNP